MRILTFLFLFGVTSVVAQGTFKSKFLKLKYTLPTGWTATEFGDNLSWDGKGNELCHCAGVLFSKQDKDGIMKVIVYPSSLSGLDSAYRNMVGNLKFEDVVKYDKTKNKVFSFEKKKSNFVVNKTGAKSYEVIRYKAKMDKNYYIIYTWQETMKAMDPDHEKALYEMVNAIEPLD